MPSGSTHIRFSKLQIVAAVAMLCAAPAAIMAQPAGADSAGYVTRLGIDTLAIERFVRTRDRVEAEVLLRIPTTTRTTYVMELGPNGDMRRLESTTYDPRSGSAEAVRRSIIERDGDTLRVTQGLGENLQRRAVAAPRGTLPFIDMIHWPYEIALVRLAASDARSIDQPLLSGARVSEFVLERIGEDSMTITHPSRGTMRVSVDKNGRLLGLDAGATTRKLMVTREPWMPLTGYVEQWAALDAAGKSLGALSGRGETRETVTGATLTVDFGTPAKRGRQIWGALVPFGKVWRTGANRATHFTTDRDLVLGSGSDTLAVPAGQYTLFSIPDRDGGVLIVSKKTDITGTAYDPAHDLGRVRLVKRPIEEPVEIFNIAVAPESQGGALRLQWDETELVVPFAVRGR